MVTLPPATQDPVKHFILIFTDGKTHRLEYYDTREDLFTAFNAVVAHKDNTHAVAYEAELVAMMDR